MMKRVLIIMILLFLVGASASAKNPVDITINDRYIKTDNMPYIEKDHTLVPVRAISEALGYNVKWNEKIKTVSIYSELDEIKLTIDDEVCYVNGIIKKLKVPARIINNRTFVPVRFVSENLGCTVSWDPKTYTVNIKKDGLILEDKYIDKSYTKEELHWLARIVNAEAEGEVMSGKIGVANVVLNRVESELFPHTIYGVIFDKKFGVQFTPVATGTIYNNPTKDSYQAAKRSLKGENNVGKSLYFLNPKISTSFWIVNNRKFYRSIGGHDFYL